VGAARALIAGLALLVGCAGVATAPDGLAQHVDTLVEPLVQARQFNGAVVLMRRGQRLYGRGWGLANRKLAVAFTPHTPSDGGSMAKTFTAAGLWWLAQEGRVSMTQPVRELVPAYPHDGVTVAHLLAHSAGLAPGYESFDVHFQPGELRTTDALLALAGQAAPAPAFEPGTRFAYSDLGYDAAARVIERVSGQAYADFVRERFFQPHGLVDGFARPARFVDWPVPRTRGYRWRDGRWQDHDAYDGEAFLGGSNLMLSADDLARWGQAWARGRALPAAAEVAGRARPLIDGRPSALNGLNWFCDAAGLRCHYTGSLNGFHALVYWDRVRGESIGVVSNSDTPPWPLFMLERRLVDRLAGRAEPAPDPWTALFETGTGDALVSLEGWVGRYALPAGQIAKVSRAGPRLQLQIDDGPVRDLEPASGSVFKDPATDGWLAFETAPAGGRRLHLRSLYGDAVAPAVER
jgi:CubicO group peptidase (beta-lactamase class C family)